MIPGPAEPRPPGRAGTQGLLTIYVVERWLARLGRSPHLDDFVLKGGMLLAVFGSRRPTVDADALARNMAADQCPWSSVPSSLPERRIRHRFSLPGQVALRYSRLPGNACAAGRWLLEALAS
jgi:hypothetical protein